MVNGDAGKRVEQGVGLPHGGYSSQRETLCNVRPQEVGRTQSEIRPCPAQCSGHKLHAECGIDCAIQDTQWATGIDAIMSVRRKANHACRTECVIQTLGQERVTSGREHLKRTMGCATMLIVYMLVCIGWIGSLCVKHGEKHSIGSENVGKEHANNNRGAKAKNRARERIRQRRLIQQRIRRWYKARKGRYEGKDRMKYRQKVRASKRWLRRATPTEAKEANNREGRRRGRKTGEKDIKRRGGSGGREGARAVNASYIEEGLMKDIG
eukprot:4825660-Pleurochrysis_carterae.AAC.1